MESFWQPGLESLDPILTVLPGTMHEQMLTKLPSGRPKVEHSPLNRTALQRAASENGLRYCRVDPY